MRIENELIASMMRNLGRHLKEEDDEGFDWSQWQVEQLKNLQEYRRKNLKEYGPRFKSINERIEEAIRHAHQDGQKDEELNILDAISKDKRIRPRYQNPSQASIEGAGDAFFRINDRKLEALVKAAHDDLEKAERAVLRRTNDQYRKIIFDAQMYANTGAGTVEKAVDMATKDFLAKGIDSIQYKNGARHTISDYADMYIRTAERRAYLMGEGKKRQEWGEQLVIVNRRGTMTAGNYGTACPQCIPWLGKILIDDVYSGGKPDGKHELLSDAMAAGFLHPRCRDSFTTYIPGISPQEDPVTKKEVKEAVEAEKEENRLQYAERQQERYERLAEYSLDPENQRMYEARANQWEGEADRLKSKLKTARRAKSVRNMKQLRAISKSDIIEMDSVEDIQLHFMYQYDIEVQDFIGQDLLKTKTVLAGYDDFMSSFTEVRDFIKNIMYSPQLDEKTMGTMDEFGFSKIGFSGLGDYGTGLHEAAHALDFLMSDALGKKVSENIVSEVKAKLGGEFYDNIIQVIGIMEPVDAIQVLNDPVEIFAYAMETKMGGIHNVVSDEIYALALRYYNVYHKRPY